MMRVVHGLALMCICFAAAPGAAVQALDPNGWSAPKETKDRVPEKEIERLVSRPMAQVENGDLIGGIATFEEMLRNVRASKGQSSVDVADLLIAFGVELYSEWNEEDEPAIAEASLSYMRQSVEAYRAAFGPSHPEVALAINSYADVMYQVAPEGEVPADVIVLLRESLKIRLATLGPDNAETRANMTKLANRIVKRGKGENSSIAEAEDLYRQALRNAPKDPEADGITGAVPVRFGLARLLADAGRAEDAVREAEIIVSDASAWPEADRCWRVYPQLQELAAVFIRHAKADSAAKLEIIAAALRCSAPEDELEPARSA